MSNQCNGCSLKNTQVSKNNNNQCVSPVPRFDSIFISDVNIKEIGNQEYQIVFTKISLLFSLTNNIRIIPSPFI